MSRTLVVAILMVAASMTLCSAGLAQGRVVEEHTRSVVASYEKAEHWAMQSIVLLSLGPVWSRAAEPMLLDALQAKDVQLRAYAIEVLALSEPEILQYGVSSKLIDQLVNKHATVKVEVYYERVEEILFNLFPATEAEKAADWKKHWRSVKRDWKRADWPEAYTEDEQERGDGATMSGAFVARAFDLYRTGLEVMLVVDSTGSMQSTIDATRAALLDLAAVLHGVAPKLKIGLVHYKDYGDITDGAKLLEKLSKKPAKIEKALEKLRAEGGGDQPEAVEAGLYVALQEDCGWSRAASKLIVIISDAQAQQQNSAEELARSAHEMPFGLKPVIPSDPKSTVSPNRPFVISALRVRHSGGARRGGGARPAPAGDDEEDEAKDSRDVVHRSLEDIAIAGGGSYSEISATGDTEPALEIVSQVLAQSFGRRFQDHTDRFLDVWMRYHRAGLFD